MTTSTAKKSLIIIDSRVNDWQRLIAELNVPVLVLDAARDGLTQIAEQLGNYSPLDAIHIVSHGASGSLLLGTTLLNRDNLTAYSAQLASFGKALTENGDLLLYGCDVAAGDAGLAFINELSVLTKADVMASNDLTGGVSQGGDWLLEVSTGTIETDALASYSTDFKALALPIVAFSPTTVQLIAEGDAGNKVITFKVVLSEPSSTEVSVNYSTSNFSALAGSDYITAMGQLVFAAGETSKTVTVEIIGDTDFETNQTFSISLSAPNGVELSNRESSASVTIINDDLSSLPIISLSPFSASITEGQSGSQLMTFTVSLSTAASSPVTVNYNTSNNTAIAGSDYMTSSGMLVFAVGETSKTFTVEVLGDTAYELNESFFVNLSNLSGAIFNQLASSEGIYATITNDDVSALPRVSLSTSNPSITEGHTGSQLMTFTATLSTAATSVVTVDYATLSIYGHGNNVAFGDYVSANGTLTFAIGETSKTFTVEILADTVYENNELFYVSLKNPSSGVVLDDNNNSVLATIDNDDSSLLPIVAFSPANVSITEGHTGSQTLTFTVTLSAAASSDIAVNYQTSDRSNDYYAINSVEVLSVATSEFTALAGSDYLGTGGTLIFAAGETSKTITVTVLGDTVNENNETFFINLRDPSNAVLSNTHSYASVTLVNDDNGTVNVAPTATNLSASETYTEDTPLNLIDIVANDVDSANISATLTLSNTTVGSLNTATSGSVTSTYNAGTGVWTASGAIADVNVLLANVTFNPTANFNGNFSIATRISDGIAPAITGVKTFTGVAVNDAPTGSATATLANGTEDTAYIITATDLLQGFSDVDGDTLTVSGLTANHGNLINNNNGTWTFTPAQNYNGTVDLNYSVVDGKTGSVNGSQIFILSAVNDAPTGSATATLASGIENTAYTIKATDLLQGFSDVDGDSLTVTGLTADQGSLVDNKNGTWTFNPTSNYIGTVNLDYNVTDGNGGSIAATQHFTLTTMPATPILSEPSSITLIDTVYDDTFNTVTGTLSVVNNGGSVLTYGIKDGIDNKNGTVSKQSVYGILTVNKTTGAYQFEVNDKAVEVLNIAANASFIVTVTDGVSWSDNKTLAINVVQNGVTESNGNNTFKGSAGTDHWAGLLGNDTYYVNNTDDSITEKANEGWDIVYSTVSYTLSPHIEELKLTGNAAINSTGNANNNRLFGNAGNNVLTGADGADSLCGGIGQDTYHLVETTAATDTLMIGAGESLAALNSFDIANGFKLGSNTLNTTGVDRLDLQTPFIAANVSNANGIDAGTIHSHSIQNGIITFDTAITASNLNDALNYLKTNITGSNTVAFVSDNNTYVFQDNGVMDTLVELVGVSATSLSTTGLATDAVWII